jgi:hypothetical protein
MEETLDLYSISLQQKIYFVLSIQFFKDRKKACPDFIIKCKVAEIQTERRAFF